MQSGVTEPGCGRKIFPAAWGLRSPGDAEVEFGMALGGETPRAASCGCKRRAEAQRVPCERCLGSGFAPGICLDRLMHKKQEAKPGTPRQQPSAC